MLIDCNICQGRRESAGGVCLGCGTPVANARMPGKVSASKPRCPNCKRSQSRELERGRFLCGHCRAVFEREDVGYLDDRPAINAEKRERQSQRRR